MTITAKIAATRENRPDAEAIFEAIADALLLIDGEDVIRAVNPAAEQFGVARVDAAVSEVKDRSAEEILSRLLSALDTFAESEPSHDDRTVLIATIGGSPAQD